MSNNTTITNIDGDAVLAALQSGSFDIGSNPYGVMTLISNYTNSIYDSIKILEDNWNNAVQEVGEYIINFRDGVKDPEIDPSSEGDFLDNLAVGSLRNVSSVLNIRSGPGANNNIVGTIGASTAFNVLGATTDSDGNTWYMIKTADGQIGYSRSEYININQSSLEESGSSSSSGRVYRSPRQNINKSVDNGISNSVTKSTSQTDIGVVTFSDKSSHLNVRSTADNSSNSNVIGQLSYGAKIKIIGEKNGFYEIQTPNCPSAFVSKEYISILGKDTIQNISSSIPSSTTVSLQNSSNHLNFRSSPNMNGDNIIGSINNSTELKVLDRTGDWTKVNYNGQEGWVSTRYLSR